MLKSKKHNAQSEWLKAYYTAWLRMDRSRADFLVEKAIKRIPAGKSIYGWSGGKDALVLQVICEQAGISDCVLGTIGKQWEYPVFWEFIESERPRGLIIKDFGITEQFMIDHPNMVFPEKSKDAYAWYRLCNQRAYYEFAKERNADNILLGHRGLDGNVKSNKSGKSYPIWDFTHEDVFCILACYGKSLPQNYFYKDGFMNGTGAWIMRSGETAMEDIYEIDKSLLLEHRMIPKIGEWLERKSYGNCKD